MKKYKLITLLISTLLYACNQDAGDAKQQDHHEEEKGEEGVVTLTKKQREALNLTLGSFQMRNLTTVVKTNGQLEVSPSSSAEVTAVVGGNVKEIKVFHGDKVSKGQVLVVLEHPDYIQLQENFAEIANKLEFLELEYNRQKELFENKVGAGKDYQQVKSEFNTTRVKYEGLKARLIMLNLSPEKVMNGAISNTITVNSPIKGFVNDINIKVGTYVDSHKELFEITDNSEIHADFMVYEKDVHLLALGQRIDFTVSNRPDEELTASIFAIGQSFEPNLRAVHIHAKLKNNSGNLIPGMYVTGHIHTDNLYTTTLPDDAIVTEGTKTFIFVGDNPDHDHGLSDQHDQHRDEMRFKMVEIITGRKDEGYTEVKLLDTMADDAKIVLNAAYYLLADLKKGEAGHHH